MDFLIRVMTELLGEPWISIINMPYLYLLETIEWKIKLEEQRSAKLGKNQIAGDKYPNPLAQSFLSSKNKG